MRIVHVNYANEYYSPFDGGAVGRVIKEQAAVLQALGHNVTVLTVPSPAGDYDTGEVVPVEIGRRHELPLTTRAVYKLKSRWLKWDLPYYDVFIRSVIARIEGMPFPPDVIITHNDLVAPRYLKARFPTATVAAMLHNVQHPRQTDALALSAPVDVFLAVSEFLRDWAVSSLGLPREKVAAVGNGVNLHEFYPPPDWPKRPEGPLRILMAARVEPNKGQDLVARAVSRLMAEGVLVKLTLAGPVWMFGSLALQTSPYLRDVLAAAHPAPCEYLGHVPHTQIPALYREHDVVCLVSRFPEGFPLSVLEAMACGCAVISSERGGLKEATGGAALVVDPDAPDTIVDALRQLATDAAELQMWKRRALERARRATWEAVVERLLEILKTCQAGRRLHPRSNGVGWHA